MINIIKQEKLDNICSMELQSGKHSIIVIMSNLDVQVCVKNAAHRAWRGHGKFFNNMKEAIENYKTPAIKSMLAFAEAELSAA